MTQIEHWKEIESKKKIYKKSDAIINSMLFYINLIGIRLDVNYVEN